MDGLIYAYTTSRSADQEAYTQARVAELTAQRRERTLSQDFTQPPSPAGLQRTTSYESFVASSLRFRDLHIHRRQASRDSAATERAPQRSGAEATASECYDQSPFSSPCEFRSGRRYLRNVPYPLPCDLAELQRQNLHTLLACKAFGKTVCSSNIENQIPRKVLEVGCGSGYWSAMCHDYFCSLGAKDVSFTGLDIAPLAPDLRRQGVDWTFVQHDFRRVPFPFNDGEFDLIMLKDLSLTLPLGVPFQRFLDENIRILRVGGTLEVWEADHVFRSILPHPSTLHSRQPKDQDMADMTGTFLMAPGTPFAPARNRFLVQANKWIAEALDKRRLPATPCVRIAQILLQEPDHLQDLEVRRIAIPLGELRWKGGGGSSEGFDGYSAHDSPRSFKARRNAGAPDNALSGEQAALRQTALMTVLQMIESMEILLREVSGKSADEWSHWWASMMNSLTSPTRRPLHGEVLEIGAWSATKISDDSDDDDYM